MLVEIHPANFDPTGSTLYVYRPNDSAPIAKIDSEAFAELLSEPQLKAL